MSLNVDGCNRALHCGVWRGCEVTRSAADTLYSKGTTYLVTFALGLSCSLVLGVMSRRCVHPT